VLFYHKIHQNAFTGRAPPRSVRGAYIASQTPSWIEEGRCGDMKGGAGRKWEGRGENVKKWKAGKVEG